MTDAAGDDRLPRLSELVGDHLGLHFPPERWRDLERGVAAAAAELGFPDLDACLAGLMAAPWSKRQVEALASHVTVGETYFFRDEAMLRALEHEVLPAIIRDRAGVERRLRLWSAGCASGEEPYTLAMVLDSLLPGSHGWTVSILATDISAAALRKAEAGVYGEWSLRATPAAARERFFTRRKDGRFEVAARLRQRVTFAQLNLAGDSYPSLSNGTNAMDLILCRNVLMYFRPERAAAVVDRLHAALVDGGWLAVSPCEAPPGLLARFAPTSFADATLYRKGDARVAPPPVPVWNPEQPQPPLALPQASSATPSFAPPTLPAAAPMGDGQPPPLPPAVPAASFEAAVQLYEQGRYSEAADAIRATLERAAGDAQALGLLARAYANLGRLAEAREWCERAIAAAKLDPNGHYLLATVLEELAEPEAADRALRHTLYLDPGFVLAHFHLAKLARRSGNATQAAKHLGNALDLLSRQPPDQVLPGSDGMTAGRLAELIGGIRGQPGGLGVGTGGT